MVFVSALNRLFWIAGEYKQRSQVMARALKEYLPGSYTAPAFGGGSFWITLPSEVDALELLRRCKHDSVWFQPGAPMFTNAEQNKNHLRLGYSAINQALIPEGVAIIARHVNEIMDNND